MLLNDTSHIEYTILVDLLFYDIATIIFCISYGLLLLYLVKQFRELEKRSRQFLFALIITFFLDLIGIIFVYIYNRETAFGLYTETPNFLILSLLYNISFILFLISPIYLIFTLEKNLFQKPIIKEKHIFSVLILLISLSIIILSFFSIFVFSSITLYIIGLLYISATILQIIFFSGGFFYLGFKSEGDFKKFAWYISIGFIWQFLINIYYGYLLSQNLRGQLPYNLGFFYIIISIIVLLRLVGLLLMAFGLLKIYSIKEFIDEADITHDPLKMFIKPKDLTEEQVILHKEQKICLVCKGKISRITYICPTCEVYYCIKCSEALVNLENACWSCETPIDESKPVKLRSEEEGKLRIIRESFKRERIE